MGERTYEQISNLPLGVTPLSGNELAELEQDGVSRKFSMSALGGVPSAHAASHKFGGSDVVGTQDKTANAIPITDGAGTLDVFVSDASATVKGKVQLATDGESAANKAVQSNDARLSNSRTPTAHAASHLGGSDDLNLGTAAFLNSGAANGVCPLNGDTQIDNNYLPPVDNAIHISNTLKKLNAGKSIKVGIFGDSLMAGAGGNPRWFELLFSETYRTSGHSLLNDFSLSVNYITVDNLAYGGTTPDLMLAQVIPLAESQAGSFGGGQISKYLYTNPPAIKAAYDIVFIDGGTNGGLYIELMIEEITRRFIESGTDVVLVSAQRIINAENAPSFRDGFHKISEHYKTSLIDFDDLYQADSGSDSYYSDSIHQSVSGHIFWADAFRNLLSTANAGKVFYDIPKDLPESRIYYFTEDNRILQDNYSIAFYNIPPDHNGELVPIVQGDGIKNPLVNHGLTNHVNLSPGEYAQYGFEDACFIVPVFGLRGSETTVQVFSNGVLAWPVKELSFPATYYTAWTVNQVTFDDCALGRVKASTDRLVKYVNSGASEISILGCIVFSRPSRQIRKDEIITSGSWTYTPWLGIDNFYNSITNGDKITIQYIGKTLSAVLGASRGGGYIEIRIDGVLITTQDLYQDTPNVGFHTYQYSANGYGNHTIEFLINGANASALTPTINERPRLAYRKFYESSGLQAETERVDLLREWEKNPTSLTGYEITDALATKEDCIAGVNINAGQLAYRHSDSKLYLYDANAESSSSGELYIAEKNVLSQYIGSFIKVGKINTTGLSAGAIYYGSETPGAITTTAPTTSGAIVRKIGFAQSSTVLFFNPSNDYVVLV